MARACGGKRIFPRAVGLTLSDDNRQPGIEEVSKDPRITVRTVLGRSSRTRNLLTRYVSDWRLSEHFARAEDGHACKGWIVIPSFLSLFTQTWSMAARLVASVHHMGMNMAPQKHESSNLPLDFFPEATCPASLELVQAADPWFHLVENATIAHATTAGRCAKWIWNLRQTGTPLKNRKFGEENIQRYQKAFAQFMYGFIPASRDCTVFSFVKKGTPVGIEREPWHS